MGLGRRLATLATAAAFLGACNAFSGPMAGLAVHEALLRAEADAREEITGEAPNTEQYDRIYENPFLGARHNPLSTFAIDVDTASYANCRRILSMNALPSRDTVRIEEFINYFDYDHEDPGTDETVGLTTEVGPCPWNGKNRLLMVGLKAKDIQVTDLPPSNLVFLVDVSGSMSSSNKLPLLQSSLKLLTRKLRPQDRVSIVAYAGRSGVVLLPTPGSEKQAIMTAIDSLTSGGSTAGGAGIRMAYELARRNHIDGGNNRILWATDGDFNVGVSSRGALTRLVEKERESGIDLSMLGFGMGNYKDSMMESLADNGNGNCTYIDTIHEARRALVDGFGSTLFTVARDVKIQIEFNPAHVGSWRLIGYENRLLRDEDFNDEKADAGEMGAGHTVTALYELTPPTDAPTGPQVDRLKYQSMTEIESPELLTVKLKYKDPDSGKTRSSSDVVTGKTGTTGADFGFAATVAEFGMLLRDSRYKGDASYESVIRRARRFRGADPDGYRAEFIRMCETASLLKR